ncbi:MAG: hypothetical protein V1839_01350 [archaeon]
MGRKSKRSLSGKPKKFRTGHLSEKTCCEPKHLLEEIKDLKISEEKEEKSAKPAKISSVTICFKKHKAKVLHPEKVPKLKKAARASQKASLKKLKTETRVLQKQVVTSKAAAKTAASPGAAKAADLQKLYYPKKAVPAKTPVIEEPVYEKRPRTDTLIDHDLNIIRPVENREIEIMSYTKRERPLNIVKDFETLADEALLKKGLTEPAQSTEPLQPTKPPVPADFRTEQVHKKLFEKRRLAPPPRPSAILEKPLQPGQKQDIQKKGFWGGVFKPKTKLVEAERPEIDKGITKRMIMHKGGSTFEKAETGDSGELHEKPETREIFHGPELQGGRGEWTIKSQLDEVLDMVNELGGVNARELAKKFGVGLDVVEGWGKVLEENKLIEIHYPAMGEPNFTKPGFVEKKEVKTRRRE